MSCGKPHETPCSEVLSIVYQFLDGELTQADYTRVRQHLDECARCLQEYGLDQVIKSLVRRCCAHEVPPADLRQKVITRIHRIRLDVSGVESTDI